MIYGDVADFIPTIIDYDELNENFDLESIDDYLPEKIKKELHKFNHLYKLYFFNKNRIVYMINNYEISLKKEVLEHLIKIYKYYRKAEKSNSYLIAEFLLSYYNAISCKEYSESVANSKIVKKEFKEIIKKYSSEQNIILEFCEVSFELYNKIIDYGSKQKDFSFYDIIGRSCSNMKFQKDKKKNL